MKFSSFIITFIVISLFVISMFSIIFSFANENSQSSIFEENSSLTSLNNTLYKQTYQQLNTYQNQSNSSVNSFIKEGDNPLVTQFGFYLRSIISAGNIFLSSGISVFSLILEQASSLLGVNALVLGALLSILSIALIFAAWRMLRSGE